MQEKTYKIGEAAQMLELKSYVLRFWETEFPQLDPLRTEKGQRLYTSSDMDLLWLIRELLHVKGMTIEGARRLLASEKNIVAKASGAINKNKPATPAYQPTNPKINQVILSHEENSNNTPEADKTIDRQSKKKCSELSEEELSLIFLELTEIRELLIAGD